MWITVYNNFKNLLESINLNVPLKEEKKAIELTPTSIFNGAYTITFDGFNDYNMYTPNAVDYDIDVAVNIGYILNINKLNETYILMMEDIIKIITTRIDAEKFNDLLDVKLKNASPSVDASGAYYIWKLIFATKGRVYINN